MTFATREIFVQTVGFIYSLADKAIEGDSCDDDYSVLIS